MYKLKVKEIQTVGTYIDHHINEFFEEAKISPEMLIDIKYTALSEDCSSALIIYKELEIVK